MGVALIAWGRFFDRAGNRITVPAPSTEPGAPWLLDFLAAEAGRLGAVGFSALQLPPISKAQGGAGAGCDGYGVFDRRDIGSKDQQGSRPTRYGDADLLRRCVANSHAAGMDVYLDVVMHQLMGVMVESSRNPTLMTSAVGRGCYRSFCPLAVSAVAWLNRLRGMLSSANRRRSCGNSFESASTTISTVSSLA